MKKKTTLTAAMLFIAASGLMAQNNVQLTPASGNICNPTQISSSINGNGFNPVSYLWNTGETTASIEINVSGTYTLTITGQHGNSPNLSTITKTATYNVLPVPVITPITNLLVCKGDTAKLAAVSGYDNVTWSNGATGELFAKRMNKVGTPGVPGMDTLTVSYIANITGVCSAVSESVMLRAIRKPDGVGHAYQNKMNINPNDSIPAGLVQELNYPVSYEMAFTDLANPGNIMKYNTAPGSRRMPAALLTPGASYSVETTPIINNIRLCPGTPSIIGIASSPAISNGNNRLSMGFTEEIGLKTYRIYDLKGQLLVEKQAETFNSDWLKGIPSQMVIVHRTGLSTEISKIQVIN